MICKNCENSFNGKFCNNCGQNSNVKRVDLQYLLKEIPNSIFQVNRGIFFTIRELFTRPGNSIREFLEGKRKRHFKPLAFVLLVSTLYVLTAYFTDKYTFLGDAISGMADSLNKDETKFSITAKILNWFGKNHSYTTLLVLPFFSLASYLVFIKSKYNYFEHLILNFYITGQQMVIYLIFTTLFFLFKIEGYFIDIIPFTIAILYLFWVFIKFFENGKILKKILLTILTYILYLTLIMFAVFFMTIIERVIKG